VPAPADSGTERAPSTSPSPDGSTGTLTTLKQFGLWLVQTSPRRTAETILVMLAQGATEGAGLLLLIPLLQLVGVDAQRGPLTRIVALFADAFQAVHLQPTLGSVLVVYVGIVTAQSLLAGRQMVLSARLQQEAMRALRLRLYRAVAGARWVHFTRGRASDYMQMLTDGVSRVGTATYSVVDLSVSLALSLVYIGLAFQVSRGMTLLVLVSGALLAVVVRGRIGRARSMGQRYASSSGALYAVIADHFGSMKLARSYGVARRHLADFERLSTEFSAVDLVATRAYQQLRLQLAVGSALVLAFIVYVSYRFLAVSTAQLLLLLFLFARLVPRLTGLYEKMQGLAAVLPAFTAVREAEARCLAEAESGTDVPEPIVPLTTQITLDRVSFAYGSSDQPAVSDLELVLPAGATTAIVGPSGAGKSTLADILIGLIEPSSGRVLVDDVPLTPSRLDAWRTTLGYVPQDTFLFHDSVRRNLLWAKPDATEPELWKALQFAAADTFVANLPDGLDTVLGDRGMLVSGGERQRLSLARALLRKPTLLILDEATSSLDSENELRVQRAVEQLHRQMTIVIITHRLSTIRHADVIHVLDQGRLVESGQWDDLVARKGRFRELHDAQGLSEPARPPAPPDTDPVAASA
jgi:ATP-binding cassette subfamily C protein